MPQIYHDAYKYVPYCYVYRRLPEAEECGKNGNEDPRVNANVRIWKILLRATSLRKLVPYSTMANAAGDADEDETGH